MYIYNSDTAATHYMDFVSLSYHNSPLFHDFFTKTTTKITQPTRIPTPITAR